MEGNFSQKTHTHTARASWLVVFELLKMKWMMLGSFEISQFLFALRFGRCFFC